MDFALLQRKQTRKFQKCTSTDVTIPIPYPCIDVGIGEYWYSWVLGLVGIGIGIGVGIGISITLSKYYFEKLLIFHKVSWKVFGIVESEFMNGFSKF